MQRHYRKHFLPLESTPEIFNELIYSLGAHPCLSFEDVLSLTAPTSSPHPAIALILVFPTTEQYEKRKAIEDASYQSPNIGGNEVVWFPQTINNACGLYGVLHALSNGTGRSFLSEPNTLIISTRILPQANIPQNPIPGSQIFYPLLLICHQMSVPR
jgi:ubiquitin carboxyl-terminal hydrolase L3